MKKALAIDIGGTKIYSCLVDENGQIISGIEKFDTPKTFEQIENTLKNVVDSKDGQYDLVAVATCGAVNNQNSAIVGSTGNIASGYSTMNFGQLSSKPVFVENDANSAAWAEYKIGASKGCSHSVLLTLGTGVGGGIIVGNQLLKGKNGTAGEMHFKMRTDNYRKCTCGSYDCFEAYASGNGLKDTAREILNNAEVTSYDVIKGINFGDGNFKKVFDKWQSDIIDGIIGLSNIFDPEVVVLSGSMAEFVDCEFITQKVNSLIVTTPTKVVKASAGNYSGMIGVSLMALERVFNG